MENKQEKINPEYYKKGSMEVIDMMEVVYGTRALIKHCYMTAFAYRQRTGYKSEEQVELDISKAIWYEKKAVELKQKVKHGKEIKKPVIKKA